MKRSSIACIVLALAAATGCGGAARAAASPGASGETHDLDQLERDLAEAERSLKTEIASTPAAEAGAPAGQPAAPAQAAPEPAPEAGETEAATEEEAPKDKEAQADRAAADLPSRPADRCSIACRAFASMRRAADRICEITGANDERCTRARQRVDSARAQLERGPCRCEP